ncbi:putative ribosome-binding factor A, mitochondrial [Polyodon spathula]|uniref:putative ribosome-binding factor A, mitochondrial n=1 Tax=Polyodon spathula TaxID=7913 RepID=UPI001B7D98AB|nr:putative ribosome-binding factor A, mitochondrial [Polyodon spathula]
MCKPSGLEITLKRTSSPQKGCREDSICMRSLNTILYKAITDLMNTYEVSPELYDLPVEISKASQIYSICLMCFIFGVVVLEVFSCTVYNCCNRFFFKVEKLLEAADFGPQENTGDSVPIVNDRRETSTSSNLFGIDHEALNRQIMEHKKRFTEKLTEPVDASLTEQQQE